jgi:hypothetical protein
MRRMSVPNVATTHRMAFVFEQPSELARAQKRMLQVQLVDAAHQPQIGLAHAPRPVVHR